MSQPRRAYLLLILIALGVLTALGFAWDALTHPGMMAQANGALLASSASAPELIHTECAGCHSNGRTKVDFDGYLDLRVVGRDPVAWRRVIRQLRSGEMPPPKSPRLAPEERTRIIAWIDEGLAQAAAADNGRIMARRLRKAEYLHAVRDLLGVEVLPDVELPSDEDIGWDRCNELPKLADDVQVAYQAAAARILEAAAITASSLFAARNDERGQAGESLTVLARRAFRRELDVLELGELTAISGQADDGGMQPAAGIKAALQALLTSPHFLQRIEILPDPAHGDPGCGQFALASGLAFLLWNSLPDDELLDQAHAGTLSANLEAQAKRMLRDPRARRLAEDFAGAWMGLNKSTRWHAIDEALELAMRQETQLFVAAIVQEDRSVLEFLDADYTFLNERLAMHYGLPSVAGDEMRRVSVAGTQRGGLLAQASILTALSEGGRQSASQRGKWVMENLLGTPPPASPFGLLEAFAQTPRDFGPGTARQILEQHRAHESCAYCHAQMDALGIALQNFDAVGAWRTHENGQPIDAAVVLPSGERLRGPASVKAYLWERKDMFIRCLSGKMLAFTLDRKLNEHERQSLDAVPVLAASSAYRFSTVVTETVKTAAFQAARCQPRD